MVSAKKSKVKQYNMDFNNPAFHKMFVRGYSNPAAFFWSMAERFAGNDTYDLVHEYVKKEMKLRIKDDDKQIERLMQELAYHIVNKKILQEKLEYIEQEIKDYEISKQIDKLIKKISRKIEFFNLTLINAEDKCEDEIRELKQLKPDINIRNIIFTIFQLKEMPDKQRKIIDLIEHHLEY